MEGSIRDGKLMELNPLCTFKEGEEIANFDKLDILPELEQIWIFQQVSDP